MRGLTGMSSMCDLHPVSHPHSQRWEGATTTLNKSTLYQTAFCLKHRSPCAHLPLDQHHQVCYWCQFIKSVNSKGTGTGYTADASWEPVVPAQRETPVKQTASELYPATMSSKLELPEAGRQGNGSSTQLSEPAALIPGDSCSWPSQKQP